MFKNVDGLPTKVIIPDSDEENTDDDEDYRFLPGLLRRSHADDCRSSSDEEAWACAKCCREFKSQNDLRLHACEHHRCLPCAPASSASGSASAVPEALTEAAFVH